MPKNQLQISTLTTDMNFYSKLISKVDPLTNTKMFKAIQIQLACQSCINAEKAHLCTHMAHLIPRWQDGDKHRRLKTIMSDRPDLINSELGGVAIGNQDQCFRAVDLKRAFDEAVPMEIKMTTPFFVTIDPCAGGEHSDFALVTTVISHGVFQVIGAETLNTKDPFKTFMLMKRHIDAVRSTYSALAYSECRIIVERNLGFEAEHLFRECRGWQNVSFLKEPNSDRIGSLTTANIKLGMTTYLNILLRENRFFVSGTHFIDTLNNQTRDALFDQMCFFSFVFSAPNTVLQKERFAISGKQAGGKDDLVMACLISVYFSADPRFIYVR